MTDIDTAEYSLNLREIEPAAFVTLGNDRIAYLKPSIVKNRPGVEVQAADGRILALIDRPRDVDVTIIRQNDLEPLSLH